MRYLIILIIFCLTACSLTAKGSNTEETNIKIIAHRGASSDAPEHTMAAYERAKKLRADYIELDLGMTKDGKLIAIHDDTVDRTTNSNGRVRSYTLSQIKQLDAGSWFNKQYPSLSKSEYRGQKIPSLEEVIKHFGHNVNYYIEIKTPDNYPGITEKLLKVLKSHQLIGNKATRGKVIIESFSSNSLKYIHQKYPELFLILLVDNPTDINLSDIADYADGVGPNYTKIQKEFVEEAHNKGLVVHCWTVDDKEVMAKLERWGVDGIFTNNVTLAKTVLKK